MNTRTKTLAALGSNAMLGWKRLRKNPYWRHLFSRHKLRGDWITWSFGKRWWLRIGRVIVRAEYMRPNDEAQRCAHDNA